MFTLAHPGAENLQARTAHKTAGDENSIGFKSIGVPGGLKAWLWLLKNHGSGTLSLREVMQPAIDYASNGVHISANVAAAIADGADRFRRFEGWSSEMMPDGRHSLEPCDRRARASCS